MPKIERLNELLTKLRIAGARIGENKKPSVQVGYTAAYALPVHERRGMKLKGKPRSAPRKGRYWDPQGSARAGYLLDVMREETSQIRRITVQACMRKIVFAQALVLAGLYLQRKSQQACPVDTGNLKASAFTRLE